MNTNKNLIKIFAATLAVAFAGGVAVPTVASAQTSKEKARQKTRT